MSTELVKLVVFPGGFNWPVWAAADLGLFARRGIEVEVTLTPGSVFQLRECAADTSGAEVEIKFGAGRCRRWRLERGKPT